MFLPNKTIKNKKFNDQPKNMSVRKTTHYGVDVVMFLLNKIIKIELSAKKNVGGAHGFKTMCKAS